MMSKHLGAVIALASLVGAGSVFAAGTAARPGEWNRETHQIGTKVTIDVYRRAPFALTGGMAERQARMPSGPWIRETRQLGSKVTVDVYRR